MLPRLVLLSWTLMTSCRAANILALAVSNSYSHFTVMEPLFRELAARGHQITVVSSFPQSKPLDNYYDINVGHLFLPIQSNLPFEVTIQLGQDPFSNMVQIWDVGSSMCDLVLKSGVLQDLYNSTTTYDLVITHLWAYECFSVFAHKFDTPLISIVTSSALPWTNARLGNPDHPAYIVNNFIDAHQDMSLYQRTINSLAWMWSAVAVQPLSYGKTDDMIRRYLDPEAPPALEVMKRTALVMVNSHFSILQSRPFTPNFVEIGGIHLKDPKPLPEDLQEWLDGASQGVIVFSLGSLVRASSMSTDTLRAFMDAFATLPHRVVFKSEEVVEAPPNVLLRKWLPQRDLLEHPNVKLLMAHGGQSSTIEAVYTGTPLVGMPLFSDQYNNIESLVLRGSAVLLSFQDLNKDKVLKALHAVLYDSRYKQNAERLSNQFKDRLASPLETAVYWTEYVIRHKGAPQLRSKAADLPWYRFLLLDVAAVLLPFVVCFYYIVKIIIKYSLHQLLELLRYSKKTKCD